MTKILKIKEKEYTTEEIIPLLSKYRLLPQIAKEIIIDEAVASIEISEEQIEQARLRFYQNNQIANSSQLIQWLEQQAMTPEELEYLLQRDVKIELFKQKTWENQIESYFLQYKEKYDQVVYSLIRIKDMELARELYFSIFEGETTFEQVARKYSQGQEASTGGVIGPVELSTPHPIITKILKQSQAGQLSPPIEIGEWIIIVRLEKYISAELDENMKQRMLRELFQNWLISESNQSVIYLNQEVKPQI